MVFPNTGFVGNNKKDYTDGGAPAQFWTEADIDVRDNEIAAIAANLRAGQYRTVFNNSLAPLLKGKPVTYTGYNVANAMPEVDLAQADALANFADGIVLDDIADQEVGIIVNRRVITGLNTSAFAALVQIYLDETTPGDLTDVESPQRLGQVTKVDAATGEIEFHVERGGGALVLPPELFTERNMRRVPQGIVSSTVLATGLSVVITDLLDYRFRAYLRNSQTGVVADFKIRMDYTGTIFGGDSEGYEIWDYAHNNTFDPNANNARNKLLNVDTILDQPTGAGAKYVTILEGFFRPSTVGTLSFQWSQGTSDGDVTQFLTGSFLEVKSANID